MDNTGDSQADNAQAVSADSGLDRRSLIKTGAAVGAAAWVLPQVVSMSAAAAASKSDCTGPPLPILLAPAQSSVITPNGARLVGSSSFCYFQGGGGTTIAGNSLGTAPISSDDYLAIRVTRPDTTQASILAGSFFTPWDIVNPVVCPNLSAWAAANLPSLTQLNPPAGLTPTGFANPINISSLLQSSATTANLVELFVYNCSGLSGHTDFWLV